MNDFLTASIELVKQFGTAAKYYKTSQSGEYNVETGSIDTVETEYSVNLYKKHIRATQFNFPNLVGKSVAMFYLANDQIGFKPNPNDAVLYDQSKYSVEDVQEVHAEGLVVLYKLLCVKA